MADNRLQQWMLPQGGRHELFRWLTHPRGYRELRSPAEMRKLLNRKIVEQNRICAICDQEFTNYNDVVPTMLIRKEWAEHGETITRTISKSFITGATEKKDQPDWMSDRRSAVCSLICSFKSCGGVLFVCRPQSYSVNR